MRSIRTSPRSLRRVREKEELFNALYALDIDNGEIDDTGYNESKSFFKTGTKVTQPVNGGKALNQPILPGSERPLSTGSKPFPPRIVKATIRPNCSSVPLKGADLSPHPPSQKLATVDCSIDNTASSVSALEYNPSDDDPRSFSYSTHRPGGQHFTSTASAVSNYTMVTGQIPRALGKRKRDAVINLVREDQRIFKDLNFYFFPNNDSHPARRMRIIKSLEYGATWVKEWTVGITHIIVDNSLNYEQLTSWLKLDELPQDIACVNETYISDCILFKMLRDPKQASYEVKGQAKGKQPRISNVSAERGNPHISSDRLLALSQQTSKHLVKVNEPNVSDGQISTSYSFEDAMSEAKALEYLPLDLEDDGISSSASTPTEDLSNDESEEVDFRRKKRRTLQESFRCMQKHDGNTEPENPNRCTVEILERLGHYYDQVHDSWRAIAYRKAVTILNQQNRKITTKREALELPGIGDRLASKIEEIVLTNRLRRLDSAENDPTQQALRLFLGIYGVGLAQATKWVERGYRNFEDLLTNAKLSENQMVGVLHYDDFAARIPRAEVEAHGSFVRLALREIDPDFEASVMGSYRRGAEDSGDIDMIITKPGASPEVIRKTVCDILVPSLFSKGFLKCTLASTRRADGSKWHGASCLPDSSVWRRIDFLLVPWNERGAALIYFTGNDIFNRSIRLLASRKGMRLNQRGLYRDVFRGKKRAKVTEGELVESQSEKKIFAALGVPWRPPEHRIC